MHYVSMWHGFSIYPFTHNIQFSTFLTNSICNGLFRSLPTFQINDPKIIVDLDDFRSLLELMVQQPLIQLLQLTTCFCWNKNFHSTLMDILKDN